MAVYEKLKTKYGPEKVASLAEFEPMKVISTGSLALDFATGLGGIPVGRAIEVFGLPSVGKTSLVYYMIGEHLRAFPKRDAYYVNIEGMFDPVWAKTLVPNLDDERFKVLHPDPGMEAVDFVNEIIRSGEASIVAFDSIGAMLGDNEGQPGKKIQAGGQSMMATHMTKLVTVAAERSGTTMVIVNQARDNFGSMYGGIHSPGGWAPKHQAALRIKMRRTPDNFKAKVYEDEIEVGFRVAAEIVKNKANAPNGYAYWNFYNRRLNYLGDKKVQLSPTGKIGIDHEQELFDLAIGHGVLNLQGGGYYYHEIFPEDKQGQRRVRGKESVFAYLRENPQAAETVKLELMNLAQNMAQGGSDEESK